MSVFSTLMGKIFSHQDAPAAQASTPGVASAPAASSGPTIGGTASASATPAGADAPTSTSVAGASPAAGSAAPAQSADVGKILDDLQSKSSEQGLNWKQSIVDMMGLLGMDNSLTARKHLATELGYTGDQSDSASMNVWLHKQVMTKLAANGGKVPTDMVA